MGLVKGWTVLFVGLFSFVLFFFLVLFVFSFCFFVGLFFNLHCPCWAGGVVERRNLLFVYQKNLNKGNNPKPPCFWAGLVVCQLVSVYLEDELGVLLWSVLRCMWRFGPWLVALLKKVWEILGGAAQLEEVDCWRTESRGCILPRPFLSSSHLLPGCPISFLLPPLLPW